MYTHTWQDTPDGLHNVSDCQMIERSERHTKILITPLQSPLCTDAFNNNCAATNLDGGVMLTSTIIDGN